MQFRKHVTKIGTAVAGRGKLAAAAIIAVGLAVGGSVAADAAGSPSIPDGSIYHIDIHDGAVGSDTIANRSIQSYDMDKALVNALLAVPDGSVTEKDLDPALKAKVNQVGTGKQGPQGLPGKDGAVGPKGDSYLTGAYYAVAYYDKGDTNAGAIATVACKAETDVAIGGGVSVEDYTKNTPVSSSFPGRMDWATNKPKPNRLDGWVVQFGGNAGAASDKAPEKAKVWALCVPGLTVPVVETYVQSQDD